MARCALNGMLGKFERSHAFVEFDSKGSEEQKAIAQATCLQTAATTRARCCTEKLWVIAMAKQMLADTASGAEAQTYSLFQVVTVSATKCEAAM